MPFQVQMRATADFSWKNIGDPFPLKSLAVMFVDVLFGMWCNMNDSLERTLPDDDFYNNAQIKEIVIHEHPPRKIA